MHIGQLVNTLPPCRPPPPAPAAAAAPQLPPNCPPTAPQLPPADLSILHFDVGGLQRPSDDDCNTITGVFPEVVSLIEWAEQLRVWGAAPEQRLALYFRRLPSVRRGSMGRGLMPPQAASQAGAVRWRCCAAQAAAGWRAAMAARCNGSGKPADNLTMLHLLAVLPPCPPALPTCSNPRPPRAW